MHHARMLQEGIARSKLVVIEGAGHTLIWTHPEELVLAGLTLVYYLAPALDRAWSWVTPGSAFAVVSWLLMSLGLRFYVGYFDYYNATYGSIGGLILLMLWLYWSGVAVLAGAVTM